jgi:hypothetical protein
MQYQKGGRGKKAPYSTKVVRVPEPILSEVEKLVTAFYSGELEVEDRLIDLDEAMNEAREILLKNQISKRTTKVCFEKLLQVIYGHSSIKL